MDGPDQSPSDREASPEPEGEEHHWPSDTPAPKKNYRRYDAGRKYRAVWQEIHPWVSRALPDEVIRGPMGQHACHFHPARSI
ncbi:hypothetical protein TCAL_16824 [Tigriopus californicus]|uniref:Uncharacterized protein n=1 Tax=Tigriopus californicus TaxID=6832 RepID=A0A553PA38_TIGCA|nr:hypothetical protein TCAL_16824 [Tigriopus californicus]